jgi:hypothetical protein
MKKFAIWLKRSHFASALALAGANVLLVLRHSSHLVGFVVLSWYLVVFALGESSRKAAVGKGPGKVLTASSLKMKLPRDRTIEQVRNHYEVERALAAELKAGSREDRMALYGTLYAELFKRVPDHDRLRHGAAPDRQSARYRNNLRFIETYLDPAATFVEFGPGDCEFARRVSPFVQKVYAADISDQRGADARGISSEGMDLPGPRRSPQEAGVHLLVLPRAAARESEVVPGGLHDRRGDSAPGSTPGRAETTLAIRAAAQNLDVRRQVVFGGRGRGSLENMVLFWGSPRFARDDNATILTTSVLE